MLGLRARARRFLGRADRLKKGGSDMEPRIIELRKRRRLNVEPLEARTAPGALQGAPSSFIDPLSELNIPTSHPTHGLNMAESRTADVLPKTRLPFQEREDLAVLAMLPSTESQG